MLVFRCECEQVLGVEDESSKGGLGECPTCGRIIRVPNGLINAAGRLRLAGTPARASASSSGRDFKVDSGKFRSVSPSSPLPAVLDRDIANKLAQIKTPAPPIRNDPASLPKIQTPEPEVLSPLQPGESAAGIKAVVPEAAKIGGDWQAKTEIGPTVPIESSKNFDSDFGLAIPQNAPGADAEPKTKSISGRKEALVKPAKSPVQTWSKNDTNDPNAAIETKNERGLGIKATAVVAAQKTRTPSAN